MKMKKLGIILLLILSVSLHICYLGSYVERHAFFYVSAVSLICMTISRKRNIVIGDISNILVLSYLLFLIICWVIIGNAYGSDYYYFIIICWLLLLVLRQLFVDRHIRKVILYSILICAWIEIVLGFGQLYGLIENNNSFFQFGGTFGNPGAYSGYLSVIFPIVLSAYLAYRRKQEYENIQYVLLACLFFMLTLIALSFSRGAWLSCMIGCILVIKRYYNVSEYMRIQFVGVFRFAAAILFGVLLILGMFLLYNIKVDSANGRLLIWKITLQTPHENFLCGDGIGAFGANYCKWQRDYFALGNGTETEHYLADYVTCAYNEFIEVFVEQGALGLFFLICIITIALLQNVSKTSVIATGAKASLSGFIILCCVSYPLQIHLMYLHFIIMLALVLSQEKKKNRVGFGIRKYMHQSFLLIAGVLFPAFGLYHLYGYFLFEQGRKNVGLGNLKDAIVLYNKAYPIVKNDGTFLFYYASALSQYNKTKAAIDILKEAEMKSSDPNIYILLGNNYNRLKDYESAKEAYQNAINITPSRLYPKYLMVKLLIDAGYNTEAITLAKKIIDAEEKIPSVAVKEIKEEMRVIINKMSNFKTY